MDSALQIHMTCIFGGPDAKFFKGVSFDHQYKKIERIGEGEVYKCLNVHSNSIVTAKWIPFDNTCNDLPSLVSREISVLKELDHVNVVRLFDVMHTPTGCYLVFEYVDYDLGRFIEDRFNPMDPHLMKSFLFQILQGVSYCHSKKVLHRDLKPCSLLLDLETKTVKLADFGYALAFDAPLSQYSTDGTTLAYRAPELLLGTLYTTAVDIWSVGCIFAEMVNRKPLFDGRMEAECMSKIIRTLGLPSERDWPGVTSACLRVCEMEALPSEPIPDLADVVPGLKPEGLDLLSKMLCMIPSRRITVDDALSHPYFKNVQLKRGSLLF